MTLRLSYAVASDVGHVREGNEDSAYAGARLAVVADGMGGHAAGEVASSSVVSTMAQLDAETPAASGTDVLGGLAAVVQAANRRLREMVESDSSLDGMGTTLTALLVSSGGLALAHVGDSRAYRLRDGELSLVTHDQTLVQRMVDEGHITREQAETHPQRALLTQALDGRDGVEPDLSLLDVQPGDRYLLCSDGLTVVVHEDTIAEALATPDRKAAAETLIQMALRGGAPDNVTVIVADVVEDGPSEPSIPLVAGAAAEKATVPGAAAADDNQGGALAGAAARARKLLPGRRRDRDEPPPPPTDPDLATAPPPPTDTAPPAADSALPVEGAPPPPPEPSVPSAPTPPPLPVEPPGSSTGPAGEQPAAVPAARRKRRRWPWFTLLGILALIVAAVVALAVIIRGSWYVGRYQDRAAVYHGSQSLPFARVRWVGPPIADLTADQQAAVRNGFSVDSAAKGQTQLLDYCADIVRRQHPTVVPSDGPLGSLDISLPPPRPAGCPPTAR